MIEQVLARRNLIRAMHKVLKNKGSAGVDSMPVSKLTELLSIEKETLTEEVRQGKYLPQAILGVEIPKSNGKTRLLGIPTVTDRLLQQSVSQVLMGKYEQDFSPRSRPLFTSQLIVPKSKMPHHSEVDTKVVTSANTYQR